jgi:hypothetical protein
MCDAGAGPGPPARFRTLLMVAKHAVLLRGPPAWPGDQLGSAG